jgi:hypothetical protein
MTYQFVAALVQALGGRVRRVRIDRVVEETYVATVEVDGPPGVQSVDARPSDALNLAALVQAPIVAPPGCCGRRRPDAPVIPHGGAPAASAGRLPDNGRHGGDARWGCRATPLKRRSRLWRRNLHCLAIGCARY